MIVVPTRGRAGRSATLDVLAGGADVIIATPDDNADAYADAYPNTPIVPVPHGIGKARQVILERARYEGWGRFWMIDDDITGVFRRLEDNLLRACPMREALQAVEREIEPLRANRIAIAGLCWRQRAWSAPRAEFDRHVGAIVLIDPAAPVNYWERHGEDLDLVLQALAAGWSTVRFATYAYTTPSGGTVDGGAKPDYDAGAQEEGVLALAAKWPHVEARLSNRTGRLQARVDWKAAETFRWA